MKKLRIKADHPYGNSYTRITVIGKDGYSYIRTDIANMDMCQSIDKHLGEFVGKLEPDGQYTIVRHKDGTIIGTLPGGFDTDEIRYYHMERNTISCDCQGYIWNDDGKYHGMVAVAE